MSFEKRIRDINKAYVERSLKIGGNRMIGAGATINDFYPNKHLGIAVGGVRPSQNLTAEEKKERARLSAEKFRNKKKGNLVSNEEVNEPVSEEEGEQPEEKHITKQVYKNKHNKRIEVIQTIDVKTMDDKPRKLKKTINGGKKAIKKGGAWYNDLDDAVMTGAHIGHQFLPLLGLGKKGKKKGGRAGLSHTAGEPVENLTIQHIRDRKKDLYTPAGVMFSQYTKPEDMRDQSVRPDMPLDLTENVKPPAGMSVWDAIKMGFTLPFRAIGAVAGLGGKKEKRVYKKKGGRFLDIAPRRKQASLSPPTKPAILKGVLAQMRNAVPVPTQYYTSDGEYAQKVAAQKSVAPVAPTTGAGKKPSKWVEFVKAYAKKNNMKYNEALKDSKCKSEYHNSK